MAVCLRQYVLHLQRMIGPGQVVHQIPCPVRKLTGSNHHLIKRAGKVARCHSNKGISNGAALHDDANLHKIPDKPERFVRNKGDCILEVGTSPLSQLSLAFELIVRITKRTVPHISIAKGKQVTHRFWESRHGCNLKGEKCIESTAQRESADILSLLV